MHNLQNIIYGALIAFAFIPGLFIVYYILFLLFRMFGTLVGQFQAMRDISRDVEIKKWVNKMNETKEDGEDGQQN